MCVVCKLSPYDTLLNLSSDVLYFSLETHLMCVFSQIQWWQILYVSYRRESYPLDLEVCCFEVENTLCLIVIYQCSMWRCNDKTFVMADLWRGIMQKRYMQLLFIMFFVERPWCNTPKDSDVKRNIRCGLFKDVIVWLILLYLTFIQFVICTKCTNVWWITLVCPIPHTNIFTLVHLFAKPLCILSFFCQLDVWRSDVDLSSCWMLH